jgi:hypothetical protein
MEYSIGVLCINRVFPQPARVTQEALVRCEDEYVPYRVGTVRVAWPQSGARLLSLPDFSFQPCRWRSLLACVAVLDGCQTLAVALPVIPTLPFGCALAADRRRALVPWMPARIHIDS